MQLLSSITYLMLGNSGDRRSIICSANVLPYIKCKDYHFCSQVVKIYAMYLEQNYALIKLVLSNRSIG